MWDQWIFCQMNPNVITGMKSCRPNVSYCHLWFVGKNINWNMFLVNNSPCLCLPTRMPWEVCAASLHSGRGVLPPSVSRQLHSPLKRHSMCRVRALPPPRALCGRLPSRHLQVRGLALHQCRALLQSPPPRVRQLHHPQWRVHARVPVWVHAHCTLQVSSSLPWARLEWSHWVEVLLLLVWHWNQFHTLSLVFILKFHQGKNRVYSYDKKLLFCLLEVSG